MAATPARSHRRPRRAIDGRAIRGRRGVGDLLRRLGPSTPDGHRPRRRPPGRPRVRRLAHGLLHTAPRSSAARSLDVAAGTSATCPPVRRHRQPHVHTARPRRVRDRCAARPLARRRPCVRSPTPAGAGAIIRQPAVRDPIRAHASPAGLERLDPAFDAVVDLGPPRSARAGRTGDALRGRSRRPALRAGPAGRDAGRGHGERGTGAAAPGRQGVAERDRPRRAVVHPRSRP